MKKNWLILFFLSICCTFGWSVEKFEWSKVVEIPPGSHLKGGNQILHFKPRNKPFWNDEQSKHFVNKYLSNAKPFTSDAEVLKYASDHVHIKGLYIELGVCTGKTINFIAALNPHQTIYGFDSFEGLPQDWIREDKTIVAGTFKFKDPNTLPSVLHNVELIKGWFKDSLPHFIKEHDTSIAFLHIDSDLYVSAATALQALGSKICPGTIIVFDELYNFPSYENHEFKAFQEFLKKYNFEAKYLAYNMYHEQVVVQIVKKSDTR